MENFNISYIFRLPNNNMKVIELQFDAETFDLLNDIPEKLPSWVELDFYQCPNCLLPTQTHSYCPVAAHLSSLLELFERLMSYDEVYVDIVTPQRIFSKKASAQKAISSLMGLVIASSGCPHTRFFRPMAVRFHMPFTDVEETIYRAASMYLLAQYFHQKMGHEIDLELRGLKDIYFNIQTINAALVERLRAISNKDVAINALVILDAFAKMVPLGIDESLEEIKYLFKPYFV
ncbi:MAG: hypothetical protein ABIB41_10745 [Nitrospirota bacterium]